MLRRCRGEAGQSHLFLRSRYRHNGIYWSSVALTTKCGREQSYWVRVPGVDNAISVVGAVPYQANPDERYICLIFKAREGDGQKLKLTRFNLNTEQWDEEPTPLDLPQRQGRGPTSFTAVVRQRGGDTSRPHVAVHAGGAIFDRRLNQDATGWEENEGEDATESDWEWNKLVGTSEGKQFRTIWAMVELDDNNFYLLAQYRNGHLAFRLFGPRAQGNANWHPPSVTAMFAPAVGSGPGLWRPRERRRTRRRSRNPNGPRGGERLERHADRRLHALARRTLRFLAGIRCEWQRRTEELRGCSAGGAGPPRV